LTATRGGATLAGMTTKSKRPKHRDRHTSPRVVFHLEAGLLEALEAFLAGQLARPERSEVVRQALRDFLSRSGHWPRPARGGG
jgi:hypothetical protein